MLQRAQLYMAVEVESRTVWALVETPFKLNTALDLDFNVTEQNEHGKIMCK